MLIATLAVTGKIKEPPTEQSGVSSSTDQTLILPIPCQPSPPLKLPHWTNSLSSPTQAFPRPENSSVPKINTQKNAWNEWKKVPSLSLCFPSNYKGCLMICLFVCGSDSETHHRQRLPSLSPRSWGRNLGPCLPSGPRGPEHKPHLHPLTLTPFWSAIGSRKASCSGVLHFAGDQGYEKGSPFPEGRLRPSREGTVTEGAFCHALQSGSETTREIWTPSWYKMSDLEWMSEALSALWGVQVPWRGRMRWK